MYRGFYINLDRNQARRTAMTRHLEEMGAASRYQRVQAVDGRAVADQYQTTLDPGNIGCWLSHLKILEANRGATSHLHIMEDDTIFARHALQSFDKLLQVADANLSSWDLIFTDVYISPTDGKACKDIARIINERLTSGRSGVIGLEEVTFAGTSSYFVNARAIDKYAKLLSGTPTDPIDLHIRKLVKKQALEAYATVPFLTSISSESSSSDISEVHRSRAVIDILRRSFFQDADLRVLDADMQKLIQGVPNPSPLEVLYLKALHFALSDQFVQF